MCKASQYDAHFLVFPCRWCSGNCNRPVVRVVEILNPQNFSSTFSVLRKFAWRYMYIYEGCINSSTVMVCESNREPETSLVTPWWNVDIIGQDRYRGSLCWPRKPGTQVHTTTLTWTARHTRRQSQPEKPNKQVGKVPRTAQNIHIHISAYMFSVLCICTYILCSGWWAFLSGWGI